MSYVSKIENQLLGMASRESRIVEIGDKPLATFRATIQHIKRKTGWQLSVRMVGDKAHVTRSAKSRNPNSIMGQIKSRICGMGVGQCVMLDGNGQSYQVMVHAVCKELGWSYRTKNIMGIKHFWRMS